MDRKDYMHMMLSLMVPQAMIPLTGEWRMEPADAIRMIYASESFERVSDPDNDMWKEGTEGLVRSLKEERSMEISGNCEGCLRNAIFMAYYIEIYRQKKEFSGRELVHRFDERDGFSCLREMKCSSAGSFRRELNGIMENCI